MILENFIVFEGIDGAGTSTQIKKLKELNNENLLFTAEPTGDPTGKFLRQMLKGDVKVEAETAAFLFAADRNEHINGKMTLCPDDRQLLVKGVKEACLKKKVVISDRYIFSSLAYQATDGDASLVQMLNSKFPLPQLLFYFDIQPSASLKRIQSRDVKEIYEKESFLEKTAFNYKNLLDEYSPQKKGQGMKIVVLDACQSIEKINGTIMEEIEKTTNISFTGPNAIRQN